MGQVCGWWTLENEKNSKEPLKLPLFPTSSMQSCFPTLFHAITIKSIVSNSKLATVSDTIVLCLNIILSASFASAASLSHLSSLVLTTLLSASSPVATTTTRAFE